MFCQKCGAAYEGNSCPNGCNVSNKPQKTKKPLFKKWWFWVVVIIVGISVASAGGGDDNKTSDNNTSIVNPTTDSDTSKETTETNEDNTYVVGEVINANGLKLSYISAEKWEGYNQYLAPDDGYMYIRLKISAENTSSSDRYISSFEFDCYADGKKVDAYYAGDNVLTGGTLSSGRATDGYIYFTVPTNAASIEVEYETSFWTDKKAILLVTL